MTTPLPSKKQERSAHISGRSSLLGGQAKLRQRHLAVQTPIRDFPYTFPLRGVTQCLYPAAPPGNMDMMNNRHHDEITHQCASVCDRMLRLLDCVAGGDTPASSELEQLASEVEVLRAALRPPQCAYDFVPSVPECLN